jgi:hypothetical protein
LQNVLDLDELAFGLAQFIECRVGGNEIGQILECRAGRGFVCAFFLTPSYVRGGGRWSIAEALDFALSWND